jgi:hypothetical protein
MNEQTSNCIRIVALKNGYILEQSPEFNYVGERWAFPNRAALAQWIIDEMPLSEFEKPIKAND